MIPLQFSIRSGTAYRQCTRLIRGRSDLSHKEQSRAANKVETNSLIHEREKETPTHGNPPALRLFLRLLHLTTLKTGNA